MKTEKVEDKIIFEMPVYLSKSTAGKLHLFQYPVRPQSNNYDNENIQKARIKPKSGQIEIEVGLRTRVATFDRSKGEQIALNVDGANRSQKDSQDNYYSSNTMDKVVLSSNKVQVDEKNFAVGIISDGALHLSPVTSTLSLKPSFGYMDMADKRSKLDQKDQEEPDTEEITKKVTVRFERPETDRSRDLKEKSYAFLQKKIRDEPWIDVSYHKYGSERSEFENQNLFCSHQNEVIDQFSLDRGTYLHNLISQASDVSGSSNPGPSPNIISTGIKSLPLEERLKFIMKAAGVASFTELITSVSHSNSKEDSSSILKAIQQIAVLVQGNWVVKSDLVHPKGVSSGSEVSNEVLQKVRDYILYLFTKTLTLTRENVNEFLEIPAQDLTKILSGVAKCKGSNRGTWEFLLPPDNIFIKKHPDVAQRQQMIWQSRHEQLSRHFKNQ